MSAYNYAAAFVAFTQGSSLPDISIQLGIPVKTLEQTSRQQGWSKLCTRLKTQAAPVLPIEKSLDALNKNREKSLKETEPLELEFDYILQLNGQMRDEMTFWNGRVDKAQEEMDAAEVDHNQCSTAESAAAFRQAGEVLLRAREVRDTLRMYLSNPKRYKELALGLAQVQELRYRALGDSPNPQAKSAESTHKALTQIVVNMPPMISQPRQPTTINT